MVRNYKGFLTGEKTSKYPPLYSLYILSECIIDSIIEGERKYISPLKEETERIFSQPFFFIQIKQKKTLGERK
jgi:hypothetical protein